MAAAEREGAALKEELAQCRELRQALLKRWHEARIAYDEVRWCRLRGLAQSILPSLPHTTPPHIQVQLQLLETQGRMAAASKGIKDAQRLHAQLVPPARPQSSAGGSSALEEEVSGAVVGWLIGLVGGSSEESDGWV